MSRSHQDIHAELAELEAYIRGIPANLAALGYTGPYVARAEALRTELVLAEARYHSERLQAPIQVARLKGAWADRHVAPLDFLGSLCRHWYTLLASAADVLRGAHGELDRDAFLALPATPGSFALSVATRHDQAKELYGVLAQGLQSGPNLALLQEQFQRSPSLDRTAYRSLLSIASENGVDLEFSFLPQGESEFEQIVLVDSETAGRVVNVLGAVEESERDAEVRGVLVAASLLKGRLEIRERSGHVVTATLQDPSLLRGARMGSRYEVKVREKTIKDRVTGKETVTEIAVTLVSETEATESADSEEAPLGSLSSELVPEGNDLAKIHKLTKVLAANEALTPGSIGVTTERWVQYYKASARVLDYLSESGAITRIGRSAARMNDVEFLRHAAIQFQVSDVGAAWLAWAGAKSIVELRKEQAEEFVKARVHGLSPSNVERRAGTLRKWLKDLQKHHFEYQEPPQPPKPPTRRRQ